MVKGHKLKGHFEKKKSGRTTNVEKEWSKCHKLKGHVEKKKVEGPPILRTNFEASCVFFAVAKFNKLSRE